MFRTLLVEDNLSFRKIIKDDLESEFPSMEIREAGDGTEALERIGSSPPDLIFMDIRLPRQNGLELTRMIKVDHPDIIVIILTSYDLPEYREAAVRYKADHFFSKSSIASDKITKLVKSILLQKGFKADASNGRS